MDLELGDEQEFEIKDNGEGNQLDNIAGYLQDILISDDFEQISNDFLRENCKQFDSDDENKGEYMLIFKQYKNQIEEFIEKKLKEQGFEIQDIFDNLNNIPFDDYIMETLTSITDYQLFKEIMLETKIRVEEEERTIKKSTNKATKGYKQVQNNNIFTAQPPQQTFDAKQLKSQKQQSNGDLRPDLFFNVIPLQTPKITRKK